MKPSRLLRNVVCALTVMFAFLTLLPPATAQSSTYPNRPIRFIVPLPAGGGADIVARIESETARYAKVVKASGARVD